MYRIKLANGATIGHMSLVSATRLMRASNVIVAVVRYADGKVVVKK